MSKAKANTTRDLLVVWWDGFGREHQYALNTGEETLWVFSEDEAEDHAKKLAKRGALKIEAWRPGETPELVARYERRSDGSANKTHPKLGVSR